MPEENSNPNWWKKSNKDKHGVVAHTPDPTRYHNTDAIGFRQAGHATMIPRARGAMGDGSRGFDHNKVSNRVVVDPDKPGGGFSVDLTKLNSGMVRKAIAGVGGNIEADDDGRENIFHVMASLHDVAPGIDGTAVKQADEAITRTNSVYPESYVVPKATLDGRQLTADATPVLESTSTAVPTAPVPMTPDPPRYATTPEILAATHGVLPAAAPDTDAIARKVLEQLAPLLQMTREPVAPLNVVRPQPVAPKEKPPVNEPAAVKETKVAFLDAANIQKPGRNVVFSWTDGGVMSCRYHEVVLGDGCLVLVYDTRYEDGMQWIPPVLNDRGTIKVSVRGDSGKQEYTVASLGLSFTLGCMDVIVLPLVGEQPAGDTER